MSQLFVDEIREHTSGAGVLISSHVTKLAVTALGRFSNGVTVGPVDISSDTGYVINDNTLNWFGYLVQPSYVFGNGNGFYVGVGVVDTIFPLQDTTATYLYGVYVEPQVPVNGDYRNQTGGFFGSPNFPDYPTCSARFVDLIGVHSYQWLTSTTGRVRGFYAQMGGGPHNTTPQSTAGLEVSPMTNETSTTLYGLLVGALSGGVTNNYGLFIGNVTGTGAFAIKTGQGVVDFGDKLSAAAGLTIDGDADPSVFTIGPFTSTFATGNPVQSQVTCHGYEMAFTLWHNSSTFGNAGFNVYVAEGTVAAPAYPVSGMILGNFSTSGWFSRDSTWITATNLQADVPSNWTNTNTPGRVTLWVSPANPDATSLQQIFVAVAENISFIVPAYTKASVAGAAGLRVPHGTAPSSPVDGDVWTTTAGMFVRVNGVTKSVNLT